MKRLLMIAFHFPPLAGSSGIQRTLRFARYLPDNGWEPIVLSAHPRAYERTSDDQLQDMAPGLRVVRAQAWDTARHFAIGGRYIGALARPDRWQSWKYDAVRQGMRLIRALRPDAIWSTYPIATAHVIGLALHQRSGLPWVADFRDPMAQDGYPKDPATWRSFARIESQALTAATASTFTTPSALALYRQRYPQLVNSTHLLENGYDEETFSATSGQASGVLNAGRLTLLHSGIVYPSERDPRALFAALEWLKQSDLETYAQMRIRFRAPVHDALLHELARRHGVEDAIEIFPAIPYREALAEMLQADALLILQAGNCNAQIPAKLYEYMRARRPMLALTDPAGDTGITCRNAGIDAIAPLDDRHAIAALLTRFCKNPNSGTHASEAAITNASRQGRTQELARILHAASNVSDKNA